MDDHAERVADQQHVAMRVEQFGNRRGVGRQADDLLAALAAADFRHGDAAAADMLRHGTPLLWITGNGACHQTARAEKRNLQGP